jgi:RND family efflux transporter MFP subunit
MVTDASKLVSRMITGKKRHSSFRCRSLHLLLAGTVLFALAGCGEDKKTEAYVRPVKTMVAKSHSGKITRTFSGTVHAQVESNLGFRVPGKILERKVNIGDKISAGQIIARLDDTDLVLSENSAKAAVASAKTRLAVTKDALQRAQKLLPKGYAPQAMLDQRKLEFDAAQSALEAAKAQAKQATNATRYATLIADKNGIVAAVHAEAGQVVAAGTPIITLAETGAMEIALSVPEQEVTNLKIGSPAQVTLWANRNVKAKGQIREIAGQADPASRTYAVRVAVKNPSATMRLGMTADVELQLGIEPSYVAIPLTALTQIDQHDAVFVVDPASSTVSPRFVVASGVTDNGIKISQGLKDGDIVITGGTQFLSTGKKVRLLKEVTAAVNKASPATH